MSQVIERGKTRCPSCVAFADYSFVEDGPDCISYEVRCGRCGEVHRETTFTAELPLLLDQELYSYTPYSLQDHHPHWTRMVAASQWMYGHAEGGMTAALTAARTKLRDLPKRLPQIPLRELEAGPRPAPAG